MNKLRRLVRRSPALIRILLCLIGSVLLSSPLTIPLYRFEYAATAGKSVIGTPALLFVIFVLLLPMWMRWVHQSSTPWPTLGMAGGKTWINGWLLGFLAGMLGVLTLYGLQTFLGWGILIPPEDRPLLRNLWEGLLVGFGVGLAEELLFRGWMLFELETDFRPRLALWLNAGIFAIAHFIRPLSAILETWPQFVGLLLLGMALVWARQIPLWSPNRSDRITTLGPAAGLHGGLVFAYYQFDVNDLVISSNAVPDWVTGIGGNPLAGLLGLILLGAIAYGTYTLSHPTNSPKTLRKER